MRTASNTSNQPSGDPSAVAPPVPIPNTEVKRCSPDDSTSIGCAKVGRRQSYAPFLAKAGNGALVFGPIAPGQVEKSRLQFLLSPCLVSPGFICPANCRRAGVVGVTEMSER